MDRAGLMKLVRATGCAEERGAHVFLCDPSWGASERAQLETLIENASPSHATVAKGWLCLPTGGTSGGVRFACHDEATLTAAAEGFRKRFGLGRVNAVDVLPPFHVSGLMARVRCAASEGSHVQWEWKRLEAGQRPAIDGDNWVISLVPTQLQRLLTSIDAVDWLRRFQIIFVGGGPTWPALVDAAANHRLRLSLSYGMTETAAMVAALTPEEFLGGARSCGSALSHATISIAESGGIVVCGESVFRGYFPDMRGSRVFATDDLGRLDEHGHLHVLGRRDAVIITGGEKVNPLEVEDTLRATGEFADIAIVGVADNEWGQIVIACYPAGERTPRLSVVEEAISNRLAGFKRPKRYVAITDWPRNAQGKLNRVALERTVRAGSRAD